MTGGTYLKRIASKYSEKQSQNVLTVVRIKI